MDVFLTIVFRASLLLYLRLTTSRMKRDTLIEHKEVAIICEENGPVSLSYNVMLTTPKANIVVKGENMVKYIEKVAEKISS
jgi:hypothetical protein